VMWAEGIERLDATASVIQKSGRESVESPRMEAEILHQVK